jgi:outer membrane protein, multidrug efflux system
MNAPSPAIPRLRLGTWATLALSMPLLLVSCAMGPNYKRPVVENPTDWRWKKAEPRDMASKGPWWEMFNDPQLNTLQQQALSENQDLRAAIARVDQSRATARVSKSDLFPTLSTNPSWERYRTSGNDAPRGGFANPSQTLNNFNIPLDLSYEIDLWGKVRRAFESSRNEFLASAAAYQNILFTLQADVALNYYRLRSVDREIDLLNQTVKLREETAALFKTRFDAGYSSELDVTSTTTELNTARASLADAKRRRALFENTLAVLCGKPSSQFELAPRVVSLAPPPVSPGLPSELLERRPDVAEAERTLAARNAEIGVAYAAFFPSVRLTASGGLQSAELSDLFSWESRVWSFGPSISLPIFAAGRNAAGLEKAKAAYEEAVAAYRQTILIAFKDVDDALAGLLFLDEESLARNAAATSARKSAELAITRFRNGVTDYLDVIDAERTRLDNELSVIRVDTERVASTILLVKAMGGGWVATPEPKDGTKTTAITRSP